MSKNYPYAPKRCDGCAEIGLATKHPFLDIPAHYYKVGTMWVPCTASVPHPECVELHNRQANMAVQGAATALLHREIVKHGEVRLSDADLDLLDVNQEIKFGREGDDFVFTHNKPDKSVPTN